MNGFVYILLFLDRINPPSPWLRRAGRIYWIEFHQFLPEIDEDKSIILIIKVNDISPIARVEFSNWDSFEFFQFFIIVINLQPLNHHTIQFCALRAEQKRGPIPSVRSTVSTRLLCLSRNIVTINSFT